LDQQLGSKSLANHNILILRNFSGSGQANFDGSEGKLFPTAAVLAAVHFLPRRHAQDVLYDACAPMPELDGLFKFSTTLGRGWRSGVSTGLWRESKL